MRFVKIGDFYFNPTKIERIKAFAELEANSYKPLVKVYVPGKTFYFNAEDLGLPVIPCTARYEAMGGADAMAERVVQAVEDALNGN